MPKSLRLFVEVGLGTRTCTLVYKLISLPALYIFDSSLDGVGGPKLRKWYGAPDLNTEDGSIFKEADESAGNLLELLKKYFCLVSFVY